MAKTMTSGEASRRLNCHVATLKRWVSEGKLKCETNSFGWKIFDLSDIEALEKERLKIKRKIKN